MKALFILTAYAFIDSSMSVTAEKCATCSDKRKANPDQDCIVFANDQDDKFYTGPFLEYSYAPCNDPEGIIAAHNRLAGKDIKCIPLPGSAPLLKNQTCGAGEYKHYHWTIQDYDVINHNKGSSIEFALTPCHGHPEIYIKPQILYAGIPMCQLFETIPGYEPLETKGKYGDDKTSTWPFPNNHTGSAEQGPDQELFELEKKAKAGTTVKYPGSFFSKQKWGHAGSITSDDGRPQPHRIRIPSISYGGFFVSVYCKTAAVFDVGLVAQKKIDADKQRYASKDEDSLAMKIRRFGYQIDDEKMDTNWGDKLTDKTTVHSILKEDKYACDSLYSPLHETREEKKPYNDCASNYYVDKFGLSPFPADTKDNQIGAHHPEVKPKLLHVGNQTTGDFCFRFLNTKDCEAQCCKWSAEGDSDIADFLKYGPFELRTQITETKGVCRPATTKQSLCVTKKLQTHMSDDNQACANPEALNGGGCERNIQATMEVTFYTGEHVDEGYDAEKKDTWPLFQLNYVEMNDCASQMNKVGHEFCWKADHDRYITEFEAQVVKPAGDAGYETSRTCGFGSGDKDTPACDPSYQTRGKCFWDGSQDFSIPNRTTREEQWTKNADDCVMWTACGVKRNGLPVMIEHITGDPNTLVKREIPAVNADNQEWDVPGSYYIYGHVSNITREAVDSPRTDPKYSREVLWTDEETWLRFPARTWVRVEVPVYNNVTYFFNVLRRKNDKAPEESYTGVSAVTTFYHKTQMYSDTTILIIAGVVVVALLFLLIPFIFTKHKIKQHLRKVYEAHKERGKGKAKEGEGDAVNGDSVAQYADDSDRGDTVMGYAVQDISAAEKEDPALKKSGNEPSKGGNSQSS